MQLRKDLAGRTRSAVLLVAAVAGLSTAALAPTAEAVPRTNAQDEIGVLFNCGSYPANQAISRNQVLARSKTWVDVHVPYSQSNCYSNLYGSYRTDCSGFVSMAWGLKQSYTTRDIDAVSHVIPRADLRPGDALNNYDSHMALFVRWADAAHTRPVVREQASSTNGTVERTWTEANASRYTPIRYDKITEDAVQPASGPMFHQVRSADGASWTGFQPLAGYNTTEIGHARDMSIAAMPDGSAQVLIVGADGRIYHQVRSADGTSWTGFQPVAGMGTNEPAGGSRVSITGMPDGSAQVLIVGADGRVYHQVRKADGNWTGFEPVAGMDTTDPAGGSRVSLAGMSDGSTQVLIVGADGRVYHQVRSAGGNWSGFAPLAGFGNPDPAGGKDIAIAGTPDGSAQVLIVGFDDRVYHQVRDTGGDWTGFQPLAGMNTADPAAGSQVSIAGMPDNSAQVTIVGR